MVCNDLQWLGLWYCIISKNDKDAERHEPSWWNLYCEGFSYAQSEVKQKCQKNRNGRVPIPDVRNLRTADSVRSIKSKRINDTKNMTVIRRCVKGTDEHGNESVTDTLQIIRFVRCV